MEREHEISNFLRESTSIGLAATINRNRAAASISKFHSVTARRNQINATSKTISHPGQSQSRHQPVIQQRSFVQSQSQTKLNDEEASSGMHRHWTAPPTTAPHNTRLLFDSSPTRNMSSLSLHRSNNKKANASNISDQANVINLNEMSNRSLLASHFIAMRQHTRHLSELKLNEAWPKSRALRHKPNPWVSSYKAKVFANEVNNSYYNRPLGSSF
jgi:hypothetical protein